MEKFFAINRKISAWFDTTLSKTATTYGGTDFHTSVLPQYIQRDQRIYDIGGGKRPQIKPDWKQKRNLFVIGVDIDENELAHAPAGFYDATIISDITKEKGPGDGDLVISRSMLEHVTDAKAALGNMASYLKPGGIMIVFVPCRNAAFARLNMFLPEAKKKKILESVYGDKADALGFKAYYNNATPSRYRAMAAAHKLEILDLKTYWMSNYFTVFAPLHILWRTYQKIILTLGGHGWGKDYCESFIYVFRKN